MCDKNSSTIHGLIRHLKIHASYGKDAAAPLQMKTIRRGSDAAKVFMEVVTKEAKEIEYLYSNKKPMIPLTKEQQDADASSTHLRR
ncbi:hypothetical protein TNCV_4105901 [Trichonephila clavipes]|nr:hypothetical protein TNCV_4105901 [Trichonephila clavipes]